MAEPWYEPSEWNDKVYDDDGNTYYTMDEGVYAAKEYAEESYYEEWYGDIDTYWAGQDDWLHREMLDEKVAEQLIKEESGYDEQMHQLYVNYKEARDQLNQARRGIGFWPVVAIPTSDGRASLAASPPDTPLPPGKRRERIARARKRRERRRQGRRPEGRQEQGQR